MAKLDEFEMSLLRQRALESLRHKARRGEVLTGVAIGYVRTEDARIEMTPDLQIQEAIRGIFATKWALSASYSCGITTKNSAPNL